MIGVKGRHTVLVRLGLVGRRRSWLRVGVGFGVGLGVVVEVSWGLG